MSEAPNMNATTRKLTISSGDVVGANDFGMCTTHLPRSVFVRDVRVTEGDARITKVEVAGSTVEAVEGRTWPELLRGMAPTPPAQWLYVQVENQGAMGFIIVELEVEDVTGAAASAPSPENTLGTMSPSAGAASTADAKPFDGLEAARRMVGGPVRAVEAKVVPRVEVRAVSVRANEQAVVVPRGIAQMLAASLNGQGGTKIREAPRFAFLAAIDNAPPFGEGVSITMNDVVVTLTDEHEALRHCLMAGHVFLLDDAVRTKMVAKLQKAIAWSWNEERADVSTAEGRAIVAAAAPSSSRKGPYMAIPIPM